MFIVFTKPNQFVKSYNEAVQIADDWYKQTKEIVAVELSQHHPQSTEPNYYILENDYED